MEVTIVSDTNRPKSLLVFINPHGGKKRAKLVFDEKVAPLFDLAGITSHVIGKHCSYCNRRTVAMFVHGDRRKQVVTSLLYSLTVTERADHAQQYIQCHDLNRYDG